LKKLELSDLGKILGAITSGNIFELRNVLSSGGFELNDLGGLKIQDLERRTYASLLEYTIKNYHYPSILVLIDFGANASLKDLKLLINLNIESNAIEAILKSLFTQKIKVSEDIMQLVSSKKSSLSTLALTASFEMHNSKLQQPAALAQNPQPEDVPAVAISPKYAATAHSASNGDASRRAAKRVRGTDGKKYNRLEIKPGDYIGIYKTGKYEPASVICVNEHGVRVCYDDVACFGWEWLQEQSLDYVTYSISPPREDIILTDPDSNDTYVIKSHTGVIQLLNTNETTASSSAAASSSDADEVDLLMPETRLPSNQHIQDFKVLCQQRSTSTLYKFIRALLNKGINILATHTKEGNDISSLLSPPSSSSASVNGQTLLNYAFNEFPGNIEAILIACDAYDQNFSHPSASEPEQKLCFKLLTKCDGNGKSILTAFLSHKIIGAFPSKVLEYLIGMYIKYGIKFSDVEIAAACYKSERINLHDISNRPINTRIMEQLNRIIPQQAAPQTAPAEAAYQPQDTASISGPQATEPVLPPPSATPTTSTAPLSIDDEIAAADREAQQAEERVKAARRHAEELRAAKKQRAAEILTLSNQYEDALHAYCNAKEGLVAATAKVVAAKQLVSQTAFALEQKVGHTTPQGFDAYIKQHPEEFSSTFARTLDKTRRAMHRTCPSPS
jgi:hypothetical protein